MATMGVDDKGQTVPIMRPVDGSDLETSLTATTATSAIDIRGYDFIEFKSDVSCKIKIGASDVEAGAADYNVFVFALQTIQFEKGDGYISIYPSATGTAYICGLD